MSVSIIILLVILVSVLLITVFLFFTFKKQKQAALDSLVCDLNIVNNKYKIRPLNPKELPVNLEETNNDDIYFCNKAVIGQYENPHKIIHDKNFNLSNSVKDNKLNLFYHLYISNFGRQKFTPLNKIDVLITKNNILLYHSLDPKKIDLSQINTLTFFWEKNPLIKRKQYFPAVSFIYQNKYYFLLFQTYNEALKFISCVNKINH